MQRRTLVFRLLGVAGILSGSILLSRSWAGQSAETKALTLKSPGAAITALAFSADGKTIFAATADQTLQLWDARTGKRLQTLRDRFPVADIAFSPDGAQFATALVGDAENKTISLWKAGAHTQSLALSDGGGDRGYFARGNRAETVSFSPDGSRLVSTHSGHLYVAVNVWDARQGTLLYTLPYHNGSVYCAVFSPDGSLIATGSNDSKIQLWNTQTGELFRTLSSPAEYTYNLAFSANGAMLASADGDATVRLWDVAAGRPLRTLPSAPTSRLVTFLPDGALLTGGQDDRTLSLWNPAKGERLRTIPLRRKIALFAFSPDKRMLAVSSGASEIGLIRLTDIR